MYRIGNPFGFTLRQAALLSARLSRGEIEEHQVDVAFTLDQIGIPTPVKGNYVLISDPVTAELSFRALVGALNRSWGRTSTMVEKAGDLLISAIDFPDTLRVDGTDNNYELILEVERERYWTASEVLTRHHTGVYASRSRDTVFYWQWEPVYSEHDADEKIGGVLEISGCMSDRFAESLPPEIAVRRVN